MARRFWWPGVMSAQVSLMSNFRAKINSYATALQMTPEEVAAAIAWCDAFIAAYNIAEQSKATMQAMTQWRDLVFDGGPVGTAATNPPEFPSGDDITYTRGVVKQFIELRDRLLTAKGYTEAIGEDLQLIGPEINKIAPEFVQPELKTKTAAGYVVNLSGSMQGMDGMRVEYAPKGGSFATVAYMTNMPGSFSVTPAVPGDPEVGQVRAVFVKKNADYGNYSANYSVTLS